MQRTELEAELERIHEASFGWTLACCRWDRSEAEEVQQEAILKVLDGRARFDGRSSFRTWLFAVIRRTAAERRRRAAVRGLLLARWGRGRPEPVPADPEREAARSAESRSLAAGLAALPARQRQVLHLVFYQDLSIREAAEVIGVTLGTARTHYERGKRRLRVLLDQEAG